MDNRLIQTYLKKLGFYTGNIDGIVGSVSKAAINAWKRSQKLFPEDGIIYPAEYVLLTGENPNTGNGKIPFAKLMQFPADKRLNSPNFSERNSKELELIVLHATAGSDKGAEEWMCNPKAQASAHLHIRRDGTIVRLVDDAKRAWHAGVSNYKGITDVNSCSIGIEIGNLNDGKEKYPEAQYLAVARIIKHYRNQGEVDVKSHYDIAPGRKTDPKGFDYCKLWEFYSKL